MEELLVADALSHRHTITVAINPMPHDDSASRLGIVTTPVVTVSPTVMMAVAHANSNIEIFRIRRSGASKKCAARNGERKNCCCQS